MLVDPVPSLRWTVNVYQPSNPQDSSNDSALDFSNFAEEHGKVQCVPKVTRLRSSKTKGGIQAPGSEDYVLTTKSHCLSATAGLLR